jgi:F-type H+-transporting ATPase subunit c
MRKTMMLVFLAAIMMCVAMPVYAQAPATPSVPAQGYWSLAIGAGLGLGIAAGLCGLGQGRATASAVEALARNPGARPGIFIFLLLGLALIESLALYALVMAFRITARL